MAFYYTFLLLIHVLLYIYNILYFIWYIYILLSIYYENNLANILDVYGAIYEGFKITELPAAIAAATGGNAA